MGICTSYESISVPVAKLILQDGRLEEFSNPVKVSQILNRHPKCFICSSDDMDVNTSLSPMDADDELILGELYFALPLTWLNCPLRPEEMGALVLKASLALEGCRRTTPGGFAGCCGMSFRRVDHLLLPPNNKIMEYSPTNDDDHMGSCGSIRYGGAGGGGSAVRGRARQGGFRKLTAILEEVDEV